MPLSNVVIPLKLLDKKGLIFQCLWVVYSLFVVLLFLVLALLFLAVSFTGGVVVFAVIIVPTTICYIIVLLRLKCWWRKGNQY